MLEIRLFGGFQLIRDGLPPKMKKSRRADSLVAFLAINLGKQHQREVLVGTLCVDMNKPTDGFRTVLKFARDALGGNSINEDFVYADKSQVRLNATEDLWVDVVDFNTPAILSASPMSTDELIRKAKLYTGPFLDGYENEPYNVEWVKSERARLETRFDQLMKVLIDRLLHEQRWNEVLTWAEHWLHHAYMPEDAYATLMMAYMRLGELSKLNETMDRYDRDMTDAEMRLSGDILDLYKRLKAGLEKERHIGVDTQAVFAPPRPRELPRQHTTFVGREDILKTIETEMGDPSCRLLTLLGLGGVGKTRLALEAAQRVTAIFPDGVAYVEMARVKSTESFVATLADALNFNPYGQESLQTQVTNYLREKTVLLILDAFEHVLDLKESDFDPVTVLEQHLLAVAPQVKIIATSRRRLRSGEERVLDLEGLDYPGRTNTSGIGAGIEKAPGDYDSVRLFLQIARNRKHDFDVPAALPDIQRICQKVQGMPLAIALAAAQIRFFPCNVIADELTHSLDVLESTDKPADPRQRTIRATFDYAWEQLDPREQTVFRSLAVFPSSFTLEAARQVAGAPLPVLRNLVDWSLLQLDGSRYQLHDLLRQFGGEKLSASTELDVYQRFSGFYLEFSRAKQKDYPALEPEWGNLLAGMRTAYEGQHWQTVIDYAQTLSEPWFTRGRFTDAREGLTWGCEVARSTATRPDLALFLRQLGRMCIEQGDYGEATGYLQESLEILEEMKDSLGVAAAQFDLAEIAVEQSNYDVAQNLLSDSQSIYEQVGDATHLGDVLYQKARIKYRLIDSEAATALGRTALEFQRKAGDKFGTLRTLRQLAEILSYSGEQALAQSYCDEAISLCHEINDSTELAIVYYILSQISRRRGNYQDAQNYGLQSLTLLRQTGNRKSQANVLLQLSFVDEDIKEYERAGEHCLKSLTIYRALNDQWASVQALAQLGDIHQHMNASDQAVHAWSDALQIAIQLNHPFREMLEARINNNTQ